MLLAQAVLGTYICECISVCVVAVGVVVVSVEGLVLLLEPELDKWLSYKPQCTIKPNGDINIGPTSAHQTGTVN